MDEKISISVAALVEWKQMCEADKCSGIHKEELVQGAFLAWEKYTYGAKSKWTESVHVNGTVHKLCYSSDIKDMFDREKYYLACKAGKIAPHPFHAIETVLYNQTRENGVPLKSWLISNEKAQSPGWLITVLFQEMLLRKFIKKQEKIAEYNESLDEEDRSDVPDYSAEKLSDTDAAFIKKKLHEGLEKESELHKASVYYSLRSLGNPAYVLTVDEIYQITGIKKVFYDYKAAVLKDCVTPLMEEGFNISEISPVLASEIYHWAAGNKLCQAMDAKVSEKKQKKLDDGSENSGHPAF